MTDLTAVNASAVTEAATLADDDFVLAAVGGVTRKTGLNAVAAWLQIDSGSAADALASAASAAASAAAAGAASGRLDVGSFAELSSKFNYTGTGGRELAAEGDVILWREMGFAYYVQATGSSTFDLNYTGSGGVKLSVLATAGAYHAVAFGAPEDGATDATAAIQKCFDVAAAGVVRKVILGSNHKITDIDLTKLYYCGLVVEGSNLTHQPSPDAATLIVSGSTSQGLDISGTSGLVFRNISIRGDTGTPPRCGLFAQRISGSNESFGHHFENVRFYGDYTDASVYNFAGEGWVFDRCILWNEGGSGRAFYGTSTNSLGRTTKHDTPDNTVTPLTITTFRSCDLKGEGAEAVWFEAPHPIGADTTIQNILFDGCYSRSRSNASGTVYKFTNIFGGVTFTNNTDESYATSDATSADSIILITGDASRVFRGLNIVRNYLYPKTYVLYADMPIQDYNASGNWVSGNKEWYFVSLTNAYHETLFVNETFRVTSTCLLVDVKPATRSALANIILPSNRMSREYDWTYNGSPVGNVNPERRNTTILNVYDNSLWTPVGSSSGVDSSSWLEMMLMRTGSSTPTSGTYEQGSLRWKSTASAGGKIGWVCTSAGTAGTLNGGATTGGITSGTTALVVNSATGLTLGCFITIAGVSGRKRVTGINGTAITIDSAADATVAGAAVAFSAPTWKEWGDIDP